MNTSIEELDLWFKMDQILNALDPDWMYSDKTEEERARGKEQEAQIEAIVLKLEELGWTPRPYIEVKIKVSKQQRLTPEEVDILAKNPLSGCCENWRK